MSNNWLKYSGMAMQFIAFLFVGYWIGGLIADSFGWNKANSRVFGMLFLLVSGLIKIVRDLLKDENMS